MTAYDMKNSAWARFTPQEREAAIAYNEEYKKFLDVARTERLATKEILRQAQAAGFKAVEEYTALKPGDKVYWNQKGKSVLLAVMGQEPLTNGFNLVGSHIDSPRLDLKAVPLLEQNKIVYFKTHYYGGIRKYQWVCIPLALVGVVYTADGSKIEVNIGGNPEDPVFFINDLLPHLAKDQGQKKLAEAIEGEQLMPLVGTNSSEEKTKPAILTILKEKYGIEEEDFISAELELVPAQKSRDVGLDRSMVMSYGHDDRVCSYGNLAGILKAAPGAKTQVAVFADKEEIGSVGNTGMNASYVKDFLAELLALSGIKDEISLRRTLRQGQVLSADVNAALDPVFKDVYEETNTAKLGYGISISKYTGSRGKSGSNDANAEFLSKVRQIFNAANVPWQIGELGKVDQGGGGTIAYILADWGCEVVDCGVAMWSMHAPLEIVSKADAYCAYLAYKAFFESK